jgi:hypothetical protein
LHPTTLQTSLQRATMLRLILLERAVFAWHAGMMEHTCLAACLLWSSP